MIHQQERERESALYVYTIRTAEEDDYVTRTEDNERDRYIQECLDVTREGCEEVKLCMCHSFHDSNYLKQYIIALKIGGT